MAFQSYLSLQLVNQSFSGLVDVGAASLSEEFFHGAPDGVFEGIAVSEQQDGDGYLDNDDNQQENGVLE